MSVRVNGYERTIVNKLQRNYSKREAEETIKEIRDVLYGDIYHIITPIKTINQNGNVSRAFPEPNDLIKAYETGDYTKFGV